MREAFGVPVGLSDHTMGIGAAVAVGRVRRACSSRSTSRCPASEGGVDSAFSLEPDELAALVRETKVAWQALGEPRIGAREAEREGLRFRRSLFVVEDVKAGDLVTAANVRSIRPANGLPPDAFSLVESKRFTRDVERGTPMSWDLV